MLSVKFVLNFVCDVVSFFVFIGKPIALKIWVYEGGESL